MRAQRPRVTGLIGIVAMLLAGCATGPTPLQADYGRSHRLAILQQTLNPEAAYNVEPVAGLDGIAAQAALEKYRKSFEKPAAPPPFIFSVGQSK